MKIEFDESQDLKNKRIMRFSIIGETPEENKLLKHVKESSETIERHENESSRVGSSDSKCQASEIRKYGIKLFDSLSEVIPKALLEDMYHNFNSYYSDEDIVRSV